MGGRSYNIREPKKVFNWMLATVEDDVKDTRVLATKRNREERYQRFSDIQKYKVINKYE